MQGIVAACYQVGLYETWPNICDSDRKMAHVSLLGEALQVVVLETLGGRIGRSSTEPFCSGNRGNAGDAVSCIAFGFILFLH